MLSGMQSFLSTLNTSVVDPVEINDDSVKNNDNNKNSDINSSNTPSNVSKVSLNQAMSLAKGFGSYVFEVSKKATEQVVEKAQILKDQVQEPINKTPVIGSFNKEQTKFLQEKRLESNRLNSPMGMLSAGLPWNEITDNDEQRIELRKQILSLSQDERNFLKNPPHGFSDIQDADIINYVMAKNLLNEDPNLSKIRFELVPKKIKEELFWRNYFYRISLICQSAHITALTSHASIASQEKCKNSDTSTESYDRLSDVDDAAHAKKIKERADPELNAVDNSEFASEANENIESQSRLSNDNQVRKQLGIKAVSSENKLPTNSAADETEWEMELQQELSNIDHNDISETTVIDDDLEAEILADMEKS